METKAGRTFSITELRANWLLNVSGSSLRVYVNWSLANIRNLLIYIYFYFWLLWKVCFMCHQHWDMWVNTLLGSWWREGILSILKGILAVQCDFLKKKNRCKVCFILHLTSWIFSSGLHISLADCIFYLEKLSSLTYSTSLQF